jgi:hypothetical protein
MARLNRYDFIKGPRAARVRRERVVSFVAGELVNRANSIVRRIAAVASHSNSIITMTPVPDKKLVKRLRIVKADYYLSKLKIERLEEILARRNEKSPDVDHLKAGLVKHILDRSQDFKDGDLIFDDPSHLDTYLQVQTGVIEKVTVGRLFNLAVKMGLVVDVKFIKPGIWTEPGKVGYINNQYVTAIQG